MREFVDLFMNGAEYFTNTLGGAVSISLLLVALGIALYFVIKEMRK